MKEKYTILIVEDEADLRGVYKLGFELDGFDVVEAVDGEDALDKVTKEEVDVILLDLMLPRKSGLDVLRDLKSEDKTKDIPVVIFTALSYGKEKQLAQNYGFSAYLVKSQSSLDDVIRTVRQTLASLSQS